MELAFKTRNLRDICEDATTADDRYDERVALHLRARLSDLRAAESPDDLVAGRPRFVDGRRPLIVLDLSSGFELVCEANHVKPPRKENGALNWLRVHRLKIVEIRGAHCD